MDSEIAYILWVVGAVGFGIFHLWQRRRWQRRLAAAEAAAEAAAASEAPASPPSAVTLNQLERTFGRAVASALLGRRLARLYALLTDPSLVLAYLPDPALAQQVEAGAVANNSTLFRCLASLEKDLEGRTFRGNPVNTLGAYLRAEFRKRAWTWPKHPLAWKQFFHDQKLNA